MKAWFLAVASLMAVATAAFAEDYPARTVKLLVGYAPGGAPDTAARIIGQRLSQILKQSFIIENRPGAGGTLAAAQTAKAVPDGYTLSVADVGEMVISPYIYKELPYDTSKDFTPVGLAVLAPVVIVSNAKTTNIKTLADLVRQAKASPGTLNYGSSGIGSIHHLSMEMFKTEAGIDVTHVPYKGAGQSVPALLGGQVPLLMSGFTAISSHAKSGQVNLLAVTSAKRFPGAPDVPTVSEFYKGFDYASEIGLLAPAGLSPEIVAKLSAALKIVLDEPETKEKLIKVGMIPNWLSPQDYAETIRQNLKKYKRAVEVAHAGPS